MSLRYAVAWLALGLATGPLVTLFHELGHMLTLASFGGFDLQLRHSSNSGELPLERMNDRVLGLIALGGPLASLSLCMLGLVAAYRLRPRPVWLALSLGSSVHFISATLAGLINFAIWAAPDIVSGFAEHDASEVATRLRLPYWLLVASSFGVALGVWWAVLRAVADQFGRVAAMWLAVGVLAGSILWTGVIGPLILP